MRRNAGNFTLLGVIVTGAIASAMMLSLAQSLSYSAKRQQGMFSRSGFEETMERVRFVVNDPKICSTALKDNQRNANQELLRTVASVKPDDSSFPVEKMVHSVWIGDAPVVMLGAKLGDAAVTRVGLIETVPTARRLDQFTTTYVMKLLIEAQRPDGVMGAKYLKKEYDLYVTTDNNTHQIIHCGK